VVTAISISPGNEHDGHHAGTLIEQQPEPRRPKRLIGDTAYGNVEVREALEQRAIGVLAPLHTTVSAADETFHNDEFAIDLDTGAVTCPQANSAPIYKPRRSRPAATGQRSARFARADCEPCPLAATKRKRIATPRQSIKRPRKSMRTPPSTCTRAARTLAPSRKGNWRGPNERQRESRRSERS
jgi:hypothetical protein